jgi:hypothetical protein
MTIVFVGLSLPANLDEDVGNPFFNPQSGLKKGGMDKVQAFHSRKLAALKPSPLGLRCSQNATIC